MKKALGNQLNDGEALSDRASPIIWPFFSVFIHTDGLKYLCLGGNHSIIDRIVLLKIYLGYRKRFVIMYSNE